MLTASEADVTRHEATRIASQKRLQEARAAAQKQRKYRSGDTRRELTVLFTERFGSAPYEWQLDVTEALLLGLDSVVIAGTGSGKTIPFMLPMLLQPKKMILIISPLKVLQTDQVRRFKKMKIPSVAVNGDTWSKALLKSLSDHEYQGIFTSPEMCLKHPEFRKWLGSKETTENMAAIIIDEAHCISQWGGDFRPAYAEVNKLRAFMPSNIPVLLTSATLPPLALEEVCSQMNVNREESFLLNLGNRRPNISYSVHHMDSSKDYAAIHALLPDPNKITTPNDLPHSIIFTNSVNDTQVLCRDLRKRYGPQFRRHIDFLHAHRTRKAKRRVMKHFRKRRIRILIATEAAGMGADIPDIELIIQFGVPTSLSVWNQRSGRGGRSRDITARAILLVEKSMFKRRKKNKKNDKGSGAKKKNSKPAAENSSDSESENSDNSNDEGFDGTQGQPNDGKDWGKKVDPDLRNYISTDGCRNWVSDVYFDNPPLPSSASAATNPELNSTCRGRACDNCEKRRREGGASALETSRSSMESPTPRPRTPTSPIQRFEPSSVHSTPSKSTNANGKRPMVQGDERAHETPSGPATRRGQHLKNVRSALETWRFKLRSQNYASSPFTPATLLPNPILTTLSSNARIKTLDDMAMLLNPPWFLAARHGQEVIDLLEKLDADEKDTREREKLERREAKKQETARLREAKRSQRTHERNQAYTSTPARVLTSSSTFNSTGEQTYPCSAPNYFTPLSPFTQEGGRVPVRTPTHVTPTNSPHPHCNPYILPYATPPHLPHTHPNHYYPLYYTATSYHHSPNSQNPSDDFLPVAPPAPRNIPSNWSNYRSPP